MPRTFTEAEDRGFTDAQKTYLLAHPNITYLEPLELPREALYLTLRHGAVTIERAMELEIDENEGELKR